MSDTEEQNQQLSAFFEEADTDLSSTDFTQRVMLDLRKQNRCDTFIWVSCCAIALAFMWVLFPYIQNVSQVIASLPGETMVLFMENLQRLSRFPLTYILALPFLAYAFISKCKST